MQELKSNTPTLAAAKPEIIESTTAELLNSLPIDAVLIGERPCIKWIEGVDIPFVEPFFAQTVERVLTARPAARQFVTGIEALIQLEQHCERVRPAGFIFHTSRCGSTLLANACRVLDGAIVISEAAVVEKILSRFFTYANADSPQALFNAALLRAAVAALGQRRRDTEQRLFVKFSALSVLEFQWIKRVWPEVPCVFMFRDPWEVIASNLRNVPEWMQFESIPEQAAAVTGLEPQAALNTDAEERCARGLARFFEAGAELAATGALMIDYQEMSVEKLIEAIEFFGFTPSDCERGQIARIAKVYSKDSQLMRKFDPDSSAKRLDATPRAREAAELFAMESYRRLRSLKP